MCNSIKFGNNVKIKSEIMSELNEMKMSSHISVAFKILSNIYDGGAFLP